jgi:hypothetical protein
MAETETRLAKAELATVRVRSAMKLRLRLQHTAVKQTVCEADQRCEAEVCEMADQRCEAEVWQISLKRPSRGGSYNCRLMITSNTGMCVPRVVQESRSQEKSPTDRL